MGVTLGPAIGPVIGGLLSQYLGWESIFWFLVIFCGVFLAVIVVVLPETCRSVVGNSSVPPQKWNRSGWQLLRDRFWPKQEARIYWETAQHRKRRPNPFASALIAAKKESGMILIFSALLYSGYMAVLSTLTSQIQSRFGYNDVQIGLCYLPIGFGSLTSRWTVGILLDRNFKREARRQGLPIVENRQQDIQNFNIELARLTVTLPMIYLSCLCIIAYGWVMDFRTSLAGPLVMLFFTGHFTTGSVSSLNTLIVDIHRQSPATAMAANNLFRCLMGAGAVAVATPLIDRIGIGWTGTFIAFLWLFFSPFLWAVFKWGHHWREQERLRKEAAGEEKRKE